MSTMFDQYYENAGDFYSPGVDRVLTHLKTCDQQLPPRDQLYQALLDHFDNEDYFLAVALQQKVDSSDWHLLIPGEISGIFQQNAHQVASSLTEAVAAVLELCDDERIFLSRAEATSAGIRFFVGDALLVEVQRIQFEPFCNVRRDRVHKAFKGLRNHGEQARIIARLQSLPGFSDAEFRLPQEHQDAPSGRLLFPFPANWATAMMSLMSSIGFPIKRSLAQELVAKFFGSLSWQHLVAAESEERVWGWPAIVAKDWNDSSGWRFYKTFAEAVFAFGKAIQSWDGEALVINHCSKAIITPGGLYLSAMCQSLLGSKDADSSITCFAPDPVELSEDLSYRHLAAEFILRLNAGDDAISLLGLSSDLAGKIFVANTRLGSSPKQMLRLGDWWLRVFLLENKHYLQIEHIEAGKPRSGNAVTPLYKATVEYDPDAESLQILGDYDRRKIASIPRVSPDDVTRLRSLLTESRTENEPMYWGGNDIRWDAKAISA